MKPSIFYCTGLFLCGLLIPGLAACKPALPSQAVSTTAMLFDTNTPEPGSTLIPSHTPSATSIPLAARVNGLEISLAEYQSELALFQVAKGTELAPEDKQRVLDDLINQALLAHAAQEKGFTVNETTLQERIEQLTSVSGGEQALQTWLSTYGYDEQSFRRALTRSIGAAWMRDQIAAVTPKLVEQAHARQILLNTADQANQVFQLLQAGNDFGNLALKYDPLTGGDLGWFPRGYLLNQDLEAAAFSLEPEGISPIIESPSGFHILQLIERDPQRALSPDALLTLQTQAVFDWLAQHRSQSQIETLLP